MENIFEKRRQIYRDTQKLKQMRIQNILLFVAIIVSILGVILVYYK